MRNAKEHWANKVEHTSVLGIKILFHLHRLFGKLPFRFALAPVVFCIWISDKKARQASNDYLQKAYTASYLSHRPGTFTSLCHMFYFAETILDKMLAIWSEQTTENLSVENEALMSSLLAQGKGAVVLTSHMGCVEALMHHGSLYKIPSIALVHSANTAQYTRLVERSSALGHIEFWEVTELNPASIMKLEEKCQKGYFIFIAGDRIPIHSKAVVPVSFLGSEAYLPTGGVILAHMLGLPLLSMTCWREETSAFGDLKGQNRYRVRFAKLADQVRLPRGNRNQECQRLMQQYAMELEHGLKESPLDWFNFYRFWGAS